RLVSPALALHDALPIYVPGALPRGERALRPEVRLRVRIVAHLPDTRRWLGQARGEDHVEVLPRGGRLPGELLTGVDSAGVGDAVDRQSTRLNSSHVSRS